MCVAHARLLVIQNICTITYLASLSSEKKPCDWMFRRVVVFRHIIFQTLGLILVSHLDEILFSVRRHSRQ